MNRNDLKKKFLRSVSKNIKCRKQDKREYLDFLSRSVDDFLEENENADYSQLCEALGNPEKYASEFSENLSDTQLKMYKTKKIAIKSIIGILIFSFLIGFYWYILEESETPLYYYSEIITIVSEGGIAI